MFSPKTVAVVGVSRHPDKVGAIVWKNISRGGYAGELYPVNPNLDQIDDRRCYPDLASLERVPDLVIVAVPAAVALTVIEQAGVKGVKNALVYAAGFKEAGEAGARLEQQLIQLADRFSINILGPNCLGFVNASCSLNATFAAVSRRPGNLRFVSQSGAIASSLFDWCQATELGLAQCVTLGNKAVVQENDVLRYLHDRAKVTLTKAERVGLADCDPIGFYLESISAGREFIRIAKSVSRVNPVFIIKPGRSSAARQAMRSHTGAIAGEDAVLEAALAQSGVIRCQTLEEFFDLARAFAWENAPDGPRVAIVSNAGGPAVISADAVIRSGLTMAELSNETKQALAQLLPRSASILNPVDVLGDALADRVAKAAEIILAKQQADVLIVILTPQIMTQIEKTAGLIGDLSARYHQPIFCSFIGGSLIAEGEKKLNQARIPSFRFPEQAIRAVAAMWQWRSRSKDTAAAPAKPPAILINQVAVESVIQHAKLNQSAMLDAEATSRLLAAAGITTPVTATVDGYDEATRFCQKYDWPVVLKLSAPGLLHKTEVGGVMTDIKNSRELLQAWDSLNANIKRLEVSLQPQVTIQIQEDVVNGVEVIVGAKRDSTFGPVLLFGAGGTLAELIVDRNLQLLPITLSQAAKLVERSKIYALLKGYRGGLPYALGRLDELIVRLGQLIMAEPQIKEMEINPVIVTRHDTFAVDAKVLINY